jgi:class 3 adenylate cyclase
VSALPRGIVAFLMTDVEGSTRLWQRDASSMDEALLALDVDVGRVVGAHGGVVITARGEGDSHFAVFERASAAVRSALELQRLPPTRVGMRVRAVVHVGEATLRDGNYFGTTVNHAARIRSCAHGGQIICSGVVAELAGDLDDDITFRSLGTHRVRDLPRPIELFQVEAAGLSDEYPPPVTLDTATSTLMTVAVVDAVGARNRLRSEAQPLEWQRSLLRTLRSASRVHDGRFLKLTGDGCMVAFEDPRAAVSFANAVCSEPSMSLRAAVVTGLVEIVEGELSGAPVLEAWDHIGHGRAGEVWLAPLVSGLLDGRRVE